MMGTAMESKLGKDWPWLLLEAATCGTWTLRVLGVGLGTGEMDWWCNVRPRNDRLSTNILHSVNSPLRLLIGKEAVGAIRVHSIVN
jgi:hypothetical protein